MHSIALSRCIQLTAASTLLFVWLFTFSAVDAQLATESTSGTESGTNGASEDPNSTSNSNDTTNDPNNGPVNVGGNSAGVSIDALGLVRASATRGDARLNRMRHHAALPNQQQQAVFRTSTLRKVSLPRLKLAISERKRAGEPIPDAMRYLAGITHVQRVFLSSDSGDVVIAGPAGRWTKRADGTVVNAESQKPVLRLEDLLVAPSAGEFQVERLAEPKPVRAVSTVGSAVGSAVRKGRRRMAPVGDGVTIRPGMKFSSSAGSVDSNSYLKKDRAETVADEHRWWWD